MQAVVYVRNGEGHDLSPQPAPHSDSVTAKKLRALVFQPAFYFWGNAA